MTDTPSASEVSFVCDLEAPPEKVWRAVAEPELRAAWLGAVEAQTCEVIEAAPPEHLVVRWTLDQPPSVVVFDIEARDGGARLTVTHRPAMAKVVRLAPRDIPPAPGAWKMAA